MARRSATAVLEPPAESPRRSMSSDHKAALAGGRDQGRTVRRYLETLEPQEPKRRGRQRTPESIKARLDRIDKLLPSADVLRKLQLTQERMDLLGAYGTVNGVEEDPIDVEARLDAFVEVAADYGQRKGISYRAWRLAGVPAEVLKRAGIARSVG